MPCFWRLCRVCDKQFEKMNGWRWRLALAVSVAGASAGAIVVQSLSRFVWMEDDRANTPFGLDLAFLAVCVLLHTVQSVAAFNFGRNFGDIESIANDLGYTRSTLSVRLHRSDAVRVLVQGGSLLALVLSAGLQCDVTRDEGFHNATTVFIVRVALQGLAMIADLIEAAVTFSAWSSPSGL